MRPPALWEDSSTADRVVAMIPVSVTLHVLVVVAALVGNWLHRTPVLPPPVYEVTLIAPILKGSPGGGQAAVAIKPPPGTGVTPPPVAASTAVPASTAMTVPVVSHGKETRIEALARVQREAFLEKMAAAEAARHAKSNETPEPKPTVVAANAQPAPTKGSGSGSGNGNGGQEYGVWNGLPGSATYQQQIQAIVTQNWDPFTGNLDPKNPPQCSITIKIGYDGTILTREMTNPSGNPSLDNSALAALTKIGQFPAPPSELKQYLAHEGITLHFDSRTKLAANGTP